VGIVKAVKVAAPALVRPKAISAGGAVPFISQFRGIDGSSARGTNAFEGGFHCCKISQSSVFKNDVVVELGT